MTLCKHTQMFTTKLSLPSDSLNAPKLEISAQPIFSGGTDDAGLVL